MRILICAIVLLTSHALAEDRMSATAFDTYTKGKTLSYGSNGRAYGAEEYLDNRRVRWSFLDGQCLDGTWYEEAGNICFEYEGKIDPQCWSFELRAGGLIARFENNPNREALFEVEQSDKPLYCLGPEVGV